MGDSASLKRLVTQVPGAIAGTLGVSENDLAIASETRDADFIVEVLGQTFFVEFMVSTHTAPVVVAAKRLAEHVRGVSNRAIPLLAVPFMGDVGRHICEEAGVAWIDLSGNARIVAPGLRIILDGRPNRFVRRGRPSSVFAPKSARIVRWLLTHPGETSTQREIARATGMDEGFVSRIVGRLTEDGYLDRAAAESGRSRIVVRDHDLLLDAWRECYRFSHHAVLQGHVAARSGDELLQVAHTVFSEHGISYAATGLAAAWALTRFAAFRVVTIYLPGDPPPAVVDRLGFREDPRGANLWLVVPDDAGVFQGAVEKDGIRCVHPVQVYLDLKEHQERAKEAAERLRADLLNWKGHVG